MAVSVYEFVDDGVGVSVNVRVWTAAIVSVSVGVEAAVCVIVGETEGVTVPMIVCVIVMVGVPVFVAVPVMPHAGTDMLSVSRVTVPPYASALPVHTVLLPAVIPEASITVPMNMVLAPRLAASPGVQNTSQAEAPPVSTIFELSDVLKAPVDLNKYIPFPLSVIIPPPPTLIAPFMQYTPGV